jgi:hypothetical protein
MCERPGQGLGPPDIARRYRQIFAWRNLSRDSRDPGNPMTTRKRLADNARADATGCTNDGNLHRTILSA